MSQPFLEKAFEFCETQNFRLTKPRKAVLTVLAEAQKPLSAYDVMSRLTEELDQPKPPTIYRAIQFWQKVGFVHVVDSLKAFVVCAKGHHSGEILFMICSNCKATTELDSGLDLSPLVLEAKQQGFSVKEMSLEVKGLCKNCA